MNADGFDPFPVGIRRSFPIEVSVAVEIDGKLVVQSPATDIILNPVANPAGTGTIVGDVTNETGRRGVLIVVKEKLI